jgi:beta-lactamase class D
MARKAKLGSGKRFKALTKKVGSKRLAAWIGRKKYGNKKMNAMSAAGRKRKKR